MGKRALHGLLDIKDVSSETKLEIIKEFRQMYNVSVQDKDDKTAIDYIRALYLFPNNVAESSYSPIFITNTITSNNTNVDLSTLDDNSSTIED